MSEFSHKSYELTSIVVAGILLVSLSAIGMSSLRNGTSREMTSGGSAKWLKEIEIAEKNLEWKKKQLREAQAKILELESQALVGMRGEVLVLETEKLEAGNLDLSLAIAGERASIDQLKRSFVEQRNTIRKILWSGFVNRKLEAGDLASGSVFKGGRITRVDQTGLLVRHDSGVARVAVGELSEELRDQLDLSIKESDEALLELYRRDSRLKNSLAREPASGEPTLEQIERAMFATLRERKSRVRKLGELVRRSRQEIQRAEYHESFSNKRSVPESLETWGERASKLRSALIRYERDLSEAIADVQEIDPDFDLDQ